MWAGVGLLVAVLIAGNFVMPSHLPSSRAGVPLGAAVRGPSVLPIAGHRTVAALPPAAGGHVNPYAFVSSEPAAMGIADYGISGTAGVVHAYSYSTREFVGNVAINSMLTSIPGSTQHYMTFQLNVVAVYTLGGTNYSYWIQDIASIDSSTRYTGWIDNIWNLSSSSPTVGFATSGELSGNGSIGTLSSGQTWYADSPGSSFPGSLVTLTWPTNVTIRVIASTVGGYPHVGFEYDDGYGWVTFDNVTFLHMKNAVDHGFVVNGYQYTPLGIFYDAEWDYTGAGAGNHNIESELNMSLDEWNGHNLEAIPNAFNFGSDTGESMDNIIARISPSLADGELASYITNGSGALGLLYNASQVAVLNVSTPTVDTGLLAINGTPLVNFRGHDANVTLAAGTYALELYNGSTPVDGGNVTLSAGTYTALAIPFPRYVVTFAETGLPAGTAWSVAIGPDSASGQGAAVNLSEKAGTYAFHVGPVAGYVADPPNGTVAVSATNVTVPVAFFPFNFSVVFSETGLPDGTPWTVEIGGNASTFTTPSGSFELPNGTWVYNVTTVNTYIASPPYGAVGVTGAAVPVDLTFVLHLGNIAGTLSPAGAALSIDGGAVPLPAGAGQFNLSMTPGAYELEVQASGYAPRWANITVTPGNVSWANFTLAALPSSPSGNGGGGPAGDALGLYVAVAAVGAAAVAAVAVLLRRRRAAR